MSTISVILWAEAEIRDIALTAPETISPPFSAAVLADIESASAFRAFSTFFPTAPVRTLIADDVLCKPRACTCVRCARSEVPEDISAIAAWTTLAAPEILPTISDSFAEVELESTIRLSKAPWKSPSIRSVRFPSAKAESMRLTAANPSSTVTTILLRLRATFWSSPSFPCSIRRADKSPRPAESDRVAISSARTFNAAAFSAAARMRSSRPTSSSRLISTALSLKIFTALAISPISSRRFKYGISTSSPPAANFV